MLPPQIHHIIVLTTMLMEKQKTIKTWLKYLTLNLHEQLWPNVPQSRLGRPNRELVSTIPPNFLVAPQRRRLGKDFQISTPFTLGCAIASCIVLKWKILKSCHILWKDEIPWRCKPRAHISTFLLTAAGSSFGNFINCFSSKSSDVSK